MQNISEAVPKCTKCGIKVSLNAKFCGGCGTPTVSKQGESHSNCPYCSKPLFNDAVRVGAETWHKHCADSVAQFKATKDVKANDIEGWNAESCPGCNQSVTKNQDRIVSAGKEWHRPCYEAQQNPQKEVSNRIDEKNQEYCPSCNKPLDRNAEKVVAAGRQWHRSCHEASLAPKKLTDNQIDEKKS